MGVAFYFLFLLVASPVKKEDACQTKAIQDKTVESASADSATVAGSPVATVKVDSGDKMYEYGHPIVLKWSTNQPKESIERFEIKVFWVQQILITSRYLVFEDEVQCRGTSNDCTEYPIERQLESRSYQFLVRLFFVKDEKGAAAGGSFYIRFPGIRLWSPPDNKHYACGDVFELYWSIRLSMVDEKKGLKIWVQKTGTNEQPIIYQVPCKDSKDDSHCKLSLETAGWYEWFVQGISQEEGQTMKSYTRRINVVEIHSPEIKAPIGGTYEYKDRGKVVVEWSTAGPNRVIEKYEVKVWDTSAADKPKTYTLTCGRGKRCDQLRLKKQKPGNYECQVVAVTYQKTEKTSTNKCDFVINRES